MNCLPFIAALVALAVMLGTPGAAMATTYGSDATNPACATLRNNVTGAPYLPEPNRDDTRKALLTWGGDPSFLGNSWVAQKQYAQAFALLQKIDDEGTERLALLPSDTPRIDFVIDRHVANLALARIMLATFYEQGRLGRPDPAEAAAFYEKAFATTYTDDRGCVHSAPIAGVTRKRYVAVLVYDLRTPEARTKAMEVLQDGGPSFATALYLLGQNMLPSQRYEFFEANLDLMAEALRNPPPTESEIYLALAGRVALWLAIAVTLFVGAIWLLRFVRRKLGHKDEASLYRAAFAAYDVIHGLVARFGLVAQGLLGCFLGLSILFGGLAVDGFGSFNLGTFNVLGLGVPYDFMVIVSGAGMFLGGVAKLVEAARISMAPKNTLVHGAARAAAETEAHAAARGAAKAPDLGNSSFSE
jgi:hypothetical protein